jgi:subfamily B ATP-binding cassette protein MsbA
MPTPGASSRQIYFRLLGYVRPHWRVFLLSVICMGLAGAAEPVLPALMKELLDNGFGNKDAHAVWFYPALIVGLFVVRGAVGFVADYGFGWLGNELVLDLRRAMFRRLVTLPTTYFDNHSSGVLVSKVAYDVTGVTSAATSVVTTIVKDSLVVVGMLGWLLYLNWRLTLITLVMIPCVAFVTRLFSARIRAASRSAQQAMGNISHTLQEGIEAQKVVKIFGGQAYEETRFEKAARAQRRANMRHVVAASAVPPSVQLFTSVALSIVIAFALHESVTDRTTVGGFVSFITAMLMLTAPLKRLTEVNAALQRGLAAAESVFELVDEQSEDDSGTVEIARALGRIDFDNVTFRYAAHDRTVLSRINLTIAPGETVALVGSSGSGKTTLANLLPRFYHLQSGRILLDGHDIESLKLASLRDNIALVSQDVVLFNDTVAANIAYGSKRDAGMAEIEAATIAAHALEFIRDMPQGFNTLIGENGVRLSGGQRQRLAIARAILKDAPVLILDEATSALDSESERHVQAALDALMENRTTLVIAHRLSTIERADRIVVLDKGRIVEIGKHADLLAAGGIYAHLHRIQYAQDQAGSEGAA